MMSSERPGGSESDSISVTKPAEYLRPSCAWISAFSVGAVVSMMALWLVIVLSSCVRQPHGDRLARRSRRRGCEHLGQADPAQGVRHHVVDPPPVGAHAAGILDPALALVQAALGHAQRAFHRFHDLHQRSEEHTSELQSRENLVCRLLLEKKKTN